MKAYVFILALIVSFVGASAVYGRGGLTTASLASCPFAGTAALDGCNGSQAGLAGKSVKYGRAYFFGTCTTTPTTDNYTCPSSGKFQGGYAQQYAQQYVKLPNWNVAGVDYPVGIPAGTTLKDPTVDSGGHHFTNLPAQCDFNITLSNYISCQPSNPNNANCSGCSCNNLTLDSLDLSVSGGVRIQITGNCTGTVTLSNSYWKRGSFAAVGALLFVQSSAYPNVIVKNNYFDNNAILQDPTSYNPLNLIEYADATGAEAGASLLSQYNVYINNRGGKVLDTRSAGLTTQYDYFEGDNYSDAQHGELVTAGAPPGQTNSLGLTWSYSTFLGPSNFGSGVTATIFPFYLYTGGGTLSSVTVDHGVFITNMFAVTSAKLNDGNAGTTPGTIFSVLSSSLQQSGSGYFYPSNFYKTIGDSSPTVTTTTPISDPGNGTGVYNTSTASAYIAPQTWYKVATGKAVANFPTNFYQTINAIALTYVYADSTGATACWSNDNPTVPTVTGSTNMIDGNPILAAGACAGSHL